MITEIKKTKTEKVEELEKERKEDEKARRALMNILEDVEEARRDAIKERDKTLAIITNFVDGLMVLDRERAIVLVNPKFEEMFMLKGKDIEGKVIDQLKEFPLLKPAISLLLKDGKLANIEREKFSPKEEITIEITNVSLKEESRNIGSLIIFHDVTRERIIEKLKSEFVSISAHQLRTPLSAIKWTLKMMLDEDLGKINSEQKDFLEKTYKTNERMIVLINDLLNVARIEEGKYIYDLKLVDISEILNSVLDVFKEKIDRKKIKLIVNIPKKKLPKVEVDTEKIKLAIQNLVANSVIYTPLKGSITISLELKNNKEIKFSIEDTGIGIPKKKHDRIFSKFFRGQEATKVDTTGTGLGLFICKNIIEAHKGEIGFKSEENKGTMFYFTLPVKKR